MFPGQLIGRTPSAGLNRIRFRGSLSIPWQRRCPGHRTP